MERFKLVLDLVFVWVLRLAMVLLVAMVVIVFFNVVLRYGFRSGIRWAEEVSLIIVIWFTFISMTLGVKENLHINISLLPGRLGNRFFLVLDAVKNVLQVFIGVVLVVYGWKLTLNGARSRLPATHLPNSVNYLVLPIVGIFIVLYAGLHLYGDLRKFGDKGARS